MSFAILMIVAGAFVLLNSPNFVKVLRGEAQIKWIGDKGTDGETESPFVPTPIGPDV